MIPEIPQAGHSSYNSRRPAFADNKSGLSSGQNKPQDPKNFGTEGDRMVGHRESKGQCTDAEAQDEVGPLRSGRRKKWLEATNCGSRRRPELVWDYRPHTGEGLTGERKISLQKSNVSQPLMTDRELKRRACGNRKRRRRGMYPKRHGVPQTWETRKVTT